jgi:hypothetical protein
MKLRTSVITKQKMPCKPPLLLTKSRQYSRRTSQTPEPQYQYAEKLAPQTAACRATEKNHPSELRRRQCTRHDDQKARGHQARVLDETSVEQRAQRSLSHNDEGKGKPGLSLKQVSIKDANKKKKLETFAAVPG